MVKYLLIILVCLAPTFILAQDEIEVSMSLSKDLIGLDEQAVLQISVSASQKNIPQPQMPNMSMFEVYSRGQSTNISIVNGQMETSVGYNYLLIPRREGTFVIKPAVVVHNQKRYVSNDVTLTVVGTPTAPGQSNQPPDQTGSAEQTDTRDVFLTGEVDKKNPFVNEQVTLIVKFFHAVKLYSTPEYSAPQTTGFWAERLEGQNTYTEMINNRRYQVYEIKTALFPTRAGELEIGSAMVTASVPVKRRRRSNDPMDGFFNDFFSRGENKMVRSRPIKINVQPLPAEGKPDNFSGTVGNFKISQSVTRQSVEVNQPITVTYRINGTGNIKTVAEPALDENNDFRIYNAKSSEKISKLNDVIGGTKVFEEVFIPKRAGELIIPGIEFNFFDPRSKKYKSVSTNAVDLKVKPAEGETFDDLAYPPVSGRTVDANLKDILFIKTDPGDLAPRKELILLRPIYLALNAIPVLILLGVVVNRKRQDKLSGDIGYARSRAARKIARSRLAKAGKLAAGNQAEKFYAEIRAAFFSYVADKLNISPHGLTGDMLLRFLSEAGTQELIMDDINSLLKKADYAQYAPGNVTRDQLNSSFRLAEKILIGMEEANLGRN